MLDLAGIVYDGEIQLEKVGFCKMETQQECMAEHCIFQNFQMFSVNATR